MQEIPSKNQIKLVVCDLDGTLLNDKSEMSDYTISVLKKCKNEGIKVCFASGRYSEMMSIYSHQIDGVDYLISSNGALVQKQNNIIHKSIIHKDLVSMVLDYIFSNKMSFSMYSIDHIYINDDALTGRIKKYENLTAEYGCNKKLAFSKIAGASEVPQDEQIVKIVLYEQNETKSNAYTIFISQNDKLHSESTGYGLVGTFESNVSKKTALQKIMDNLGITSDNVCVFGDFDNDLSMFSVATYKIAMENAIKELKDEATYITDSNNADGVAKYLEKVLNKY